MVVSFNAGDLILAVQIACGVCAIMAGFSVDDEIERFRAHVHEIFRRFSAILGAPVQFVPLSG
jgi:hypothetical protein